MAGMTSQIVCAEQGAPARAARLDFLDAVRAIAIIGMLLTHLVALSHVPERVDFAFAGRSSIVFAVLAGISAVLMTQSVARRQGAEDPTAMTAAGAKTLLKRGFWLYLICLIISPLSFGPVVILGTYAVLMVLAIPLLYIRDTRILIALTALSAVVLPVVSYFLRANVCRFTTSRAWSRASWTSLASSRW